MTLRRRGLRLLPVLVTATLLAACATGPVKSPSPATVMAQPEAPAPLLAPLVNPAEDGTPWAELTSTFAMQDCTDAPAVRVNAAMYTRSPARFQQLLQQSLPLMLYVHAQLKTAGIPGEFVMLPMLESSYNPAERSRNRDPGGMWQLMPTTARQHGVSVNRQYDGRLDPVASTRAAISMLTALQKQFGDWRLVDLAYNLGPYAIVGALRDHPDIGTSAMPDLPVGNHARTHLARLLALSCILRQPERYHVELPRDAAPARLQTVEVPAGTSLAGVAKMAQVDVAQLRALNPGYLGNTVPADSPRTLLLPAPQAQSLVAALALSTSESVAQVTTPEPTTAPSDTPLLPAEPTPPPAIADTAGAPAHAAASRTSHHRVRKGDTLWSIAHRYHVSVADLKRWNDLRGNDLRMGEEIRVRG